MVMAVERSAIDAQLREIGEGEHWWEQREFRALPHILQPEEKIRGIVVGKLLAGGGPRVRPAARWLVVVTEGRLIGVKQERFARKQVEIPREQISRIVQGGRLSAYQITIETPQRRYRIRIPKRDAFRFAGALAPLVPDHPPRALSREVEAFSWIPGMTTVAALPGVAGIVSRVSLLSPPAPGAPTEQIQRMEAAIDRLHGDVERLQQQVEFLEDLLQKRADEAFLQRSSPG
jgi:hypothetical protein